MNVACSDARVARGWSAAMALLVTLSMGASSAAAQTPPPLLGVTSGSTPDVSQQVLCASATTQTTINGGLSGTGGAAYNTIRGSLFYTDGAVIYELAACSGTWAQLCQYTPTRVLGGQLEGLTFDATRRHLLALESRAGAAVVHTLVWDAATCLTPVGFCTVSNIPSPNHTGGGIAYDANHDAILIAMSARSGPANSRLLSWPRSATCRTQCSPILNGCGLGPVRALAFDASADTLYASDGRTVATFALSGLCQTPMPRACCAMSHPTRNTWAGFDLDLSGNRGSNFQTLPHSCGPVSIAYTGRSCLGSTVQTSIQGASPGVPFIGLGFLPSSAFCSCTIGHSWSAVLFGTSHTLNIPSNPPFLGVQIAIQGAGFLTPGGCASPQVAFTDTIVVTID